MASKDKVTIGLTQNGKTFLDQIFKLGWFHQDLDLAKFAISYAISKKVNQGEAKGASTVWNVGSLDSDGSVSFLIGEIYGERETPYKLAEYLIDEGLKMIVERVNKKPDISLFELLAA